MPWYVVGVRPSGERLILSSHPSERQALRQAGLFSGLEGYQSIVVEEDQSVSEKPPRNSLVLKEAAKQIPPVNAAEALRRQLQLALFESISAADVAQLATKLKDQALKGDQASMRLLLGLINQAPPEPRSVNSVQQLAILSREPDAPTRALPGSESKLRVMETRAEAGQNCFHPGDATFEDAGGSASTNGHAEDEP